MDKPHYLGPTIVAQKDRAVRITFYNLLGVQVADYELDKNDERLRLQTASWDPGIYMYQLIIDGHLTPMGGDAVWDEYKIHDVHDKDDILLPVSCPNYTSQ